MKIPQQFNQFEDKRTLFIIAGKQDAVMYEAFNGTIDQIDTFSLPHSNFFNDGPFYKARSQGGMTRSGPVREVQDQKVVSDFIRELRKHMAKVRGYDYSEVHIMAEAKSKNSIVEALPDVLKKRVVNVMEGNYFRSGPLDIIKKVQIQRKRDRNADTVEARNILDKAEHAKRYIRDTY